MDLNFYSDLSDGCAQNVDSEFLDSQAYGGYPEENKVTSLLLSCFIGTFEEKDADTVFQFAEGSDSYLTISGAGHPFLSAEVRTVV